MQANATGVVIVGAGPAGLAPLFAAAIEGRLDDLLRLGVTILEKGSTVGSGALPEYAISSDSSAEAFLDIVVRTRDARFQPLVNHPVTRELIQLGKNAAPLALVAQFLQIAGQLLAGLVMASERGLVLTETEAISVTQVTGSRWRTRFRQIGSLREKVIESQFVVLATGAIQPVGRLLTDPVAGVPLLPLHKRKLLQSGTVLAHSGLTRVRERLNGRPNPKVVIVGGSTSAGATASRLLAAGSGLQFGEAGITLIHRQPLRIFYESVAEAHAESYTEFTQADVCPLTGRVFRFGGFRLETREMIMSALGLGGRSPEPRLRLLHLTRGLEPEARQLLESADLVIAALGYRPRLLPIFDDGLRPITLFSPKGEQWSVVDQRCRVLNETGQPLENLFAIGLAVGPLPTRSLGGEVDFKGQINSLWMWQHTIGLRIASELWSWREALHNAQLPSPASRGIFFPLPMHPTSNHAFAAAGAAE